MKTPKRWHNGLMLEPAGTVKVQDWMTAPGTAAVMKALAQGETPKALFVGGCVRNMMLGLPVGDIDVATVWTPQEVTQRLEKAKIKVIPTGIDHGTVTAVSHGKTFEITTLRRDVATDGRRAVVAFTEDWIEDAQRRDFTMNTLLAGPDGSVYDPTGAGIDDLKAGRVIFVGDAAQRIREDYLRILRFFRFHAYYGRGELDAEALAACRAAAGKISTLSRERITQEFLKMLALPDPAQILDKMFDNKVLSDLPHKKYDPSVLTRLCKLQKKHSRPAFGSRLAVLAGLDAKYPPKMEKYLVLSNAQKKDLDETLSVIGKLDKISEKTIKQLIYKYNNEYTIQAVLLFSAANKKDYNDVVGSLNDWKAPRFPLNGEDVKKLGIKTGPEVGRLLKKTEEWWLKNDFTPDRAACQEKLKTLVG